MQRVSSVPFSCKLNMTNFDASEEQIRLKYKLEGLIVWVKLS